jgi:small nuclear ribonucleoprotein (snRNP)-like protein
MFPLTLLRKAENRAMLVELKNGETYNGHLQSCDTWMNLQLREVTLTSRVSGKPTKCNTFNHSLSSLFSLPSCLSSLSAL